MSWKPPVTSADRLRARLDDEFETVAKPEGLRRTSDLRRAAESTG
ncbi:RecX family transcriptional regulator, partial [Achromobacter xylosoxidans]